MKVSTLNTLHLFLVNIQVHDVTKCGTPRADHVESDEKLMWGVNECSYPHYWLIGFGWRKHTHKVTLDELLTHFELHRLVARLKPAAAFVDNIVGVHTKPVEYASQ